MRRLRKMNSRNFQDPTIQHSTIQIFIEYKRYSILNFQIFIEYKRYQFSILNSQWQISREDCDDSHESLFTDSYFQKLWNQLSNILQSKFSTIEYNSMMIHMNLFWFIFPKIVGSTIRSTFQIFIEYKRYQYSILNYPWRMWQFTRISPHRFLFPKIVGSIIQFLEIR